MQKSFLFLMYALLIVSPFAVHAQDDDDAPQVIFADGVEIVDVRYDVPMRSRFSAWERVIIDNEARVIHVFQTETGEWLDFAFPPEVETLEMVMQRSDGTFLFNQPFGQSDFGPIPSRPHRPELPLWNFDLTTEAFTPSETICGGYARQLAGDGAWAEYTDSRVNRTALCNTETGELQRIVPDDGRNLIGQSPDGAWEVYSVRTPPNNYSVVEVYSVEVATGREIHLGTVENPAFGSVSRYWVSDTRGVIFDNEQPESWKHNLLTFDVTEVGSLEYLMSGWARYRENPARFEHLNTFYENEWRSEWDSDSCILYVYEFAVETLLTSVLGNDCFGRVVRRDDEYLFVTNLRASYQRALYALDTQTGGTRFLFSDELLLGIDSISPNGRYAILFMGEDTDDVAWYNETLSTWPYEGHDPARYEYLGSRHLVVYDLVNEQAIANVRSDWGRLTWFDRSSFLVDNDYSYGLAYLNVLHISESGVEQLRYFLHGNYRFELSPNGEAIIAQRFMDYTGKAMVYWINEKVFVPVIDATHDVSFYDYGIEWVDDTLLEVSVSEDNPYNSLPQTTIYTIRVPRP